MGTKIQKQYLDLCGKPVLYYSLHAFQEYLAGPRHWLDLNAVPNLKLGER